MNARSLYNDLAFYLAHFEREKAQSLTCRTYHELEPYFGECATLCDQRAQLKAIFPDVNGKHARLDRDFDAALGELTRRALNELELADFPTP